MVVVGERGGHARVDPIHGARQHPGDRGSRGLRDYGPRNDPSAGSEGFAVTKAKSDGRVEQAPAPKPSGTRTGFNHQEGTTVRVSDTIAPPPPPPKKKDG